MTAFTRPRRQLDIAAEVSGRVTSVRVDVGQRIDGNEPVVLLDEVQAHIAHDLAKSGLRAAQQALEVNRLLAVSAEQEAGLRARTAARTKTLTDDGKLSQEELDMTLTAAQMAEVAMKRAVVAVDQAQTAVTQAQLECDRTQEILKRHRVTAPSGWLVATRLCEPGSMIAVGVGMLRVVDTSILTMELQVSTDELNALRKSPQLTLSFPRHGEHTALASLARMDPQFDAVTRKRRIELEITGDAAPEAVGGLEVTLSLPISDPSGGLLIPKSLVRLSGERQSVRTTDGNDILITVLRQQGDFLVVLPDQLSNVTLAP
jgi:multidrug efflux pump subunit AcrA (membrane-fusion protein)